MKGYILNRTKDKIFDGYRGCQHIVKAGFETRVFETLNGVKISLGSYGKNWKEIMKRDSFEIWEVEITPTKKLICPEDLE